MPEAEGAINGLGRRLNDAEKDLSAEKVRSLRNESDVKDLWSAINEIKAAITDLSVKVGCIVGAGFVLSIVVNVAIGYIRKG